MSEKAQLTRMLFLDFDGVLHPINGPAFSRLPLLEAWLRQRTDLGIVISSSWREHMSSQRLAELFSPDLRQRLVGATPVLSTREWHRAPGRVRHTEVLAWLDQNQGIKEWGILDDQALLFPPGLDRLVITDGRMGLAPKDLRRLEVVLAIRRQPS